MTQGVWRLSFAVVLLPWFGCSGGSARDPLAPTQSAILTPATESTLVVGPSGGVRASNVPPRLVLRTTPALDTSTSPPTLRGTAPFTVQLNLCGSSDADAGDSLNWQFHFGDSGAPPFDASGVFKPDFDHQCRAEHTYREGNFTATLSVTDKHLEDQSRDVGALARTTQQIQIVSFVQPPEPPPATPAPPAPLPTAGCVLVVAIYSPGLPGYANFAGGNYLGSPVTFYSDATCTTFIGTNFLYFAFAPNGPADALAICQAHGHTSANSGGLEPGIFLCLS
jgi:hypothetical protein